MYPASRFTRFIVALLLLTSLLANISTTAVAQSTLDIQAGIIWNGGLKPTVAFQLYRSSATTATPQLVPNSLREVVYPSTGTNWFGLPLNDPQNNPYTYTLKQGTWDSASSQFTEGLTNYSTEISPLQAGRFTITNTYVIPTAGVFTATKNWIGGISPRPTIRFQLFRRTSQTSPELVPNGTIDLPDGTTSAKWENLEETDHNGLKYEFTIEESYSDNNNFYLGAPPGFTATIDYALDKKSVIVTNTYTAATIDIVAKKVWVNGVDPIPEVAFRLYRQSDTTPREALPDDQIKTLPAGTTTVTWPDMPTFDSKGSRFAYSVVEGLWNADKTILTEGSPIDYAATYSTDRLTVTNTYSPQTPNITAAKDWEGGPATKPTVWFKLFRQIVGGPLEEAPDAEILELKSGTTSVTWPNQVIKDPDDNPYIFSVKEVNSTGQAFTPEGYTKIEVGLTVTNTFSTNETGSWTVKKEWVNGPKIRPTIGLRLFRQSSSTPVEPAPNAQAKELVNGVTTATWDNLKTVDAFGNPYIFSVREGTWNADKTIFTEGAPTSYKVTYSSDANGTIITNTYVIPKINVTGTKIWSGGPTTKPNIQLQLYRNGGAMGSPYTLTNGVTSYTWQAVDQTDINGVTYQYTVDEVSVPVYYSKRVAGMTVTNTYTGSYPYTGDTTHNSRWLILLLGLAAILLAVSWFDLKLLTRRKG